MSDEDVVSRNDDYERRLSHAGSTEGIISGLVEGAERSRKFIFWLTISLVLDVFLSLSLGALALVAWGNSDNVKEEAHQSCVQSAKNSVVINSFLQLLITSTQTSTLLTDKEKATRISGYRKLIINIPDCYKPPALTPSIEPAG
jgi:hypothetical protein